MLEPLRLAHASHLLRRRSPTPSLYRYIDAADARATRRAARALRGLDPGQRQPRRACGSTGSRSSGASGAPAGWFQATVLPRRTPDRLPRVRRVPAARHGAREAVQALRDHLFAATDDRARSARRPTTATRRRGALPWPRAPRVRARRSSFARRRPSRTAAPARRDPRRYRRRRLRAAYARSAEVRGERRARLGADAREWPPW